MTFLHSWDGLKFLCESSVRKVEAIPKVFLKDLIHRLQGFGILYIGVALLALCVPLPPEDQRLVHVGTLGGLQHHVLLLFVQDQIKKVKAHLLATLIRKIDELLLLIAVPELHVDSSSISEDPQMGHAKGLANEVVEHHRSLPPGCGHACRLHAEISRHAFRTVQVVAAGYDGYVPIGLVAPLPVSYIIYLYIL